VSKNPAHKEVVRRILVPIDFKEQSMRALTYAVDLARQLGAEVIVTHVYQIPTYSFLDGSIITPPQLASQLADAAQKNLDQAVRDHKSGHQHISGLLRNGNAWEEICLLGKEQGIDLIVMGTHGRRGIARAILGSVAENVVRTSDVPVLIAHGSHD
jgi:nucleotide-binding universal stress UspA family protein